MRGQLVVVKDFTGKALVRRLWEIVGNAVYVTNDAGLALLERGLGEPSVGFPIEDVFVPGPGFDPARVSWSKLRPLRGYEGQ